MQYIFNFFQFCDSVPNKLKVCQPDDQKPSYTSWQYYDKFTRQKVLLKDEIFCTCPEGYNYLDQRYIFRTKGHYETVQINSYCLPVSTMMEKFKCKVDSNIIGSCQNAPWMKSAKRSPIYPASFWLIPFVGAQVKCPALV